MPPRTAISNLAITVVILFFMFIIALLLKGRWRLPSEQKAEEAQSGEVPKAVPLGQKIAEPRAYKSGSFWVLPHPSLVISRSNEADTLRVKSGPKEDVFVLYGIDAVQRTLSHPKLVADQSALFGGVTQTRVLDVGSRALSWVTDLLAKHPFIVYTKFARVPDTERYYALVRVETEPGKQQDLGELLVKHGYAMPNGTPPDSMPDAGLTPENYKKNLGKELSQAKVAHAGAWAR